jgi:hypothetical protein
MQMQDDIDALKKNQMQLASTVQGLHQAYITLQVQAQKQSEIITKIQLEFGMLSIKAEVSQVDPSPFGGGGWGQPGNSFSMLDRRRQEPGASAPKSMPMEQDSSTGAQLVELAGVLGDDDDMGQDVDDLNTIFAAEPTATHMLQWGSVPGMGQHGGF